MNKLYKIQKGGYKINTEHKRLVFFLLDCSKVFFISHACYYVSQCIAACVCVCVNFDGLCLFLDSIVVGN